MISIARSLAVCVCLFLSTVAFAQFTEWSGPGELAECRRPYATILESDNQLLMVSANIKAMPFIYQASMKGQRIGLVSVTNEGKVTEAALTMPEQFASHELLGGAELNGVPWIFVGYKSATEKAVGIAALKINPKSLTIDGRPIALLEYRDSRGDNTRAKGLGIALGDDSTGVVAFRGLIGQEGVPGFGATTIIFEGFDIAVYDASMQQEWHHMHELPFDVYPLLSSGFSMVLDARSNVYITDKPPTQGLQGTYGGTLAPARRLNLAAILEQGTKQTVTDLSLPEGKVTAAQLTIGRKGDVVATIASTKKVDSGTLPQVYIAKLDPVSLEVQRMASTTIPNTEEWRKVAHACMLPRDFYEYQDGSMVAILEGIPNTGAGSIGPIVYAVREVIVVAVDSTMNRTDAYHMPTKTITLPVASVMVENANYYSCSDAGLRVLYRLAGRCQEPLKKEGAKPKFVNCAVLSEARMRSGTGARLTERMIKVPVEGSVTPKEPGPFGSKFPRYATANKAGQWLLFERERGWRWMK